ncbi:MAG TPA: cyanate hydratase, partial [Pseudomonas sp.]|nr:cyanate hydratase [Pseudomonas sp.]
MIQTQATRTARQELTEVIIQAKARKDLSFAQIVDGTGLSEAFVTAALLGQHPLPESAAKVVGE